MAEKQVWQDYWSSYPEAFDDTDYQRQVQRTVGGEPAPEASVDAEATALADRLQLGPHDRLLDLCCGNGLMTARLAGRCASVVGVDFSPSLLAVAQEHFQPPHVTYLQADVRHLDALGMPGTFTRALMAYSLQYLDAAALPEVLRGVHGLLEPGGILLFAHVPDRALQRAFLDTPRRWLRYHGRRVVGRNRFGTFWSRDEVQRAAAEHGFDCTIVDSLPSEDGKRYRFDAVLVAR